MTEVMVTNPTRTNKCAIGRNNLRPPARTNLFCVARCDTARLWHLLRVNEAKGDAACLSAAYGDVLLPIRENPVGRSTQIVVICCQFRNREAAMGVGAYHMRSAAGRGLIGYRCSGDRPIVRAKDDSCKRAGSLALRRCVNPARSY